MNQSITLYPRRCDVTGEGMFNGYCIGEGQMYIKHYADMLKHLHEIEKLEAPHDNRIVADDLLFDKYYQSDYYYFTQWDDSDDIQFVEVDGKMYEEGEAEFDKHFTHSWNKDEVAPEPYTDLKNQVTQLLKLMDDNTRDMWRDDLQCTHECVVLEDVEDGVKMDECDNPIGATNGNLIGLLIQKIKQTHLD